MVLAAIRGELTRYRLLGEAAISRTSDQGLHATLGTELNSIAVLVRHIGGNLRSRFTDFLVSDGEKEWRDREGEFDTSTRSHAELLEDWARGWDCLEKALGELDEHSLGRTVRIRGVELSVIDALERSLAHLAYHVGQIVLLARWQAGTDWQSLSIPRGGTAAYNMNPDKERQTMHGQSKTSGRQS